MNIDDTIVKISWLEEDYYATRSSYVKTKDSHRTQYINTYKDSKVKPSARKCTLNRTHKINI